jgi:type III secretion protein L
MSFLLWQRDGVVRIASPKIVLRAAEVPLLADALALRDALEELAADASTRLADATEAARAAGRDEGLADGRRAAADELASRLAELARSAAQDREALRDQVGALALQVVRKMLGHFAEDEVLVGLADRAAGELLPERPVALAVHPARVEALRRRMSNRSVQVPDAPPLACEVRGDPACGAGDCWIETAHGRVDASLETQLARLETAWAGSTA